MNPPKPSPLACAKCGQHVPATARNYAFVMCADCIPPQFQPSRRRLTQAEFEREAARARGETPRPAEPTLDLSEDGPFPIRPAGLDKPLRTRTGRRRSWWQRGWKR